MSRAVALRSLRQPARPRAEARFYRPRHGRFAQVDPVYAGLFDPQQWNRYAYARNNPLGFVDPDGRNLEALDRPAFRVEVEYCSSCDNRFFIQMQLMWYFPGIYGSGLGAGSGSDGYSEPGRGRGHAGVVPPPPEPTPDPTPPGPAPPDRDGDANSGGNSSGDASVGGDGDSDLAGDKLGCLKKNFSFSLKATNRFFFSGYTRLARTLIGFGTAGAVARGTGLTSVRMAWSDLRHGQGVANLGARGTLMSVGAHAAVNAALTTAALEIGIVVGAAIDSGVQTFALGRCQ